MKFSAKRRGEVTKLEFDKKSKTPHHWDFMAVKGAKKAKKVSMEHSRITSSSVDSRRELTWWETLIRFGGLLGVCAIIAYCMYVAQPCPVCGGQTIFTGEEWELYNDRSYHEECLQMLFRDY